MISSTPRPHFTPGKDPVPILQEDGSATGPVWTGGKSRPHRESIPDRPARSQSLYRLSYRAHRKAQVPYQNRCAITCNLHAIKSPRDRSWGVSITLSMPTEYQQWLLSDAFEAQRPGNIKEQRTASSTCPNATRHLSAFTTARQKNSVLILPSYHPTSISYILISSSQLRLSSKRPISFTFPHQKFCTRFSARPHMRMSHLSHSTCC